SPESRTSKITSCATTLCPGWLYLHSKKSPSRRGKPPDVQIGNTAFARTHHRLSASTVHSRRDRKRANRRRLKLPNFPKRVPGSSPGGSVANDPRADIGRIEIPHATVPDPGCAH